MIWELASKAVEFRTYLTYNENDLHPVCAFTPGENEWYRITEGPEDEIIAETGSHEVLRANPTHIMELDLLMLPSSGPDFLQEGVES